MEKQERFNELLKAGAHFGHLKRKWHPKMAPYIFMEKNDVHIIDLHKTLAKIELVSKVLKQLARTGKKIMFVGTKKQAKESIENRVKEINMPYVTERWPGGMLTNFVTIRKAVRKMDAIDRIEKDKIFENLSKRERLQILRQRKKLEKNLGSISDLTRIPGALFVVDIKKEHIAVSEARKLGIPCFAIADTNTDPTLVEYAIPGNDDSSSSIDKILKYVIESIKEGLSDRKKVKEERLSEIKKVQKVESKKEVVEEKKEKKLKQVVRKKEKTPEKKIKKDTIVKQKTAAMEKKEGEAISKKKIASKKVKITKNKAKMDKKKNTTTNKKT